MLSNVWFSIIINGASHGFFKSVRGLRRGDLLSPALFVIGTEIQLRFVGFRVPHGCLSITNLAFADDVLVFANGSSSSLQRVMQVLELY